MANPSTAHEPSMEEILASIRQIISEDGEPSPADRFEAAADDAPESEAEKPPASSTAPTKPVAAPKPDAAPAQSEPVKAQAPQTSNKPASQPFGSAMTSSTETQRRPDFASSPTPTRAPAEPVRPARTNEDKLLLSERSDTAVSGAFNALAHTILAQNARTLEDLVGEMLRPMLRDWLDENLPSLVERLVREEIERVSRGRR